jgi:argininosuccinate synthase
MPGKDMVLAYSGGLDTSVILDWNIKKGYSVIAFMADVGQQEDLEGYEKKAYLIGAKNVIVVDLKEKFVRDFVFPAIRGNAKYEGKYLLGTSLARPVTAQGQVNVAKEVGAEFLSNGATGKGNDQLRFERAYASLFPEAEVDSPWKLDDFLKVFGKRGRDALMEYAEANGIPIDQTTRAPWSSDANLLHRSFEAGPLENPMAVPPEHMFKMTVSPQEAPNSVALVEINFEKGNPVMASEIVHYTINPETLLMKDIEYGEEHTNPVDLVMFLNKIAGANAVGRVDMVENRDSGMKSRGVYETPGGTVLYDAHEALERITLDREVMKINQHLRIDLAERIYSGYWFSDERGHLQHAIDHSQDVVNGFVRLGLYKGNVINMGTFSPDSLYDEDTASMHGEGGFDQRMSTCFIYITSQRLKTSAKRKERMDEEKNK